MAVIHYSNAFETGVKPTFVIWLRERLGTRHWVVAGNLSPRLRQMGYEKAISQRKFNILKQQFQEETGYAPY